MAATANSKVTPLFFVYDRSVRYNQSVGILAYFNLTDGKPVKRRPGVASRPFMVDRWVTSSRKKELRSVNVISQEHSFSTRCIRDFGSLSSSTDFVAQKANKKGACVGRVLAMSRET